MAEASSVEASYDKFFLATRDRLLAQAAFLTGDTQNAQDIVQEALARAWISWRRVGQLEDPEGWTRHVLHNLAVSELRHRRLRQIVHRAEVPEPHADSVDLMRAMARLPFRQRRALVLYYYADLSVADVAGEMRLAPGTVKSLLSRGRVALEAALRERDGRTDQPRRQP